MKRMRNMLAGGLLVALIMVGIDAMTPSAANATPCGAGEDMCSAAESDGYDSFCFNLWKIFKFCYDVTYYHPPEPPPGG